MTIIDLIAVVLVCATLLGFYALQLRHRRITLADARLEHEYQERQRALSEERLNTMLSLRDAAQAHMREARDYADTAAKAKTDVTALVEGINANFDKVREEISLIKAALGYGRRT